MAVDVSALTEIGGKLENAISSGPRDDATAEKRDDMAVLTGLALPIRESTQTKGIFVFFDGTLPPPANFLHSAYI